MDILIIEDDSDVARLIEGYSQKWGHDVEISGSGQEAMGKAKKKDFDMVFLDIFLPDCEGHSLISKFREMQPDINIVAMTGRNSAELEWEIRQQKVLYHMIKPVEMKEIKSVLAHIEKKTKPGGKNPTLGTTINH